MSTTLTTATPDLRYPIGKAQLPETFTEKDRADFIEQIEEAPAKLREAIRGLTEQQLDTPYRPDGWTVRQLVHHLVDSHLNSYVRFKLALTENEPTIKPYDEKLWAELPDGKSAPVDVSLALFEDLHRRFVLMLRAITPEQWLRKFRHPERGLMSLESNLALYGWHGRHHVAHITELRKRMGW